MYTVLASILGKSKIEVEPLVGMFFSNKELFDKEEVEYWEFLRSSMEVSDVLPSKDYFTQRFPDTDIYLDAVNKLSIPDVSTYFRKEVIDQKKRLYQQLKLSELVSTISQTGLTTDVFEEIRKLRGDNGSDLPEVPYSISDAFRMSYEERETRPTGIVTGIQDIDAAVGGASEGSVTTIMGFTGSRKTTWALNIAYNNVVHFGYNACFVSLELPREDIWISLASLHSRNPKFGKPPLKQSDIRNLNLTDEQRSHLLDVVVPDLDTYESKLQILETSDFRSRDFEDIYERMCEVDDAIDGGVDVWFWDHIQMLKFSQSKRFRGMDEGAIMNAYVHQIMEWALEFRGRRTTHFILAQANRGGWLKAARPGGRYDLTGLAEVNECERASTRVFSIFSAPDLEKAGSCKIQVLKSRYGNAGNDVFEVFCDGETYYIGGMFQGYTALGGTNISDFSGMDDISTEGLF